MNRQIVKLFGFTVALFAVLIAFTSYWSVFDAKALKDKEANKRPLLEQQQIKRGRILAADGTVIARSVPKGHGAGLRYVRRYPEGDALRPPDRLQLRPAGGLRIRAVPQRPAGRRRIRIRLDPRRAARQEAGRQRHRHQHRPAGPAGRPQRPRSGGLRRGRRDRTEHRPGPGDGLQRAVRPEPGPLRTRKAERERSRSPAPQPRDPVALPAGLDLQGGDRRRRARQRHDHPGNGDRRARLDHRRRPAPGKRLQHLLHRPPRRRPDQLGQHLVRAGRRQGRRGHAVRIHGTFRLQHQAADRPALRRAPGERARRPRKRRQAADRQRPDRHRARRDRAGAPARHAAAEARWSPPPSPTGATR